ncbi:MAG: phenylpyruvate tautomerase MIF-related protein [Cyanobacteria bacterium P01_G01_bin.54]
MPLIKLQTSVAAPEPSTVETLLKTLSIKVSEHFGKSEAYVMTAFEPNVTMTFGGTTEPVCYLEIKNIGTMKPEQTKAMSQDFCQVVEDSLGVPQSRIYIEFADAQRHLWGWNSRTFG